MAARKKSSKKKRKQRPRSLVIRWWVPVGVLVLLAAAVALPYIAPRDEETGAPVPPGNWRYGIDLSHHNRTAGIQWDSLRVMTDMLGRTTRSITKARTIRPLSFVILKATEGESFRDRKFPDLWKAAAAHDLPRGAYHFYRSSRDPLVQAEHFIRTVGPLRHQDLPPVLDVETLHPGCDLTRFNSDLLLWLQTVGEYYGRTPVVYAPESFVRDYLSADILDNYPLWIAHYGVLRPLWSKWQWWQFSDRAVVYGIHGMVDLSVIH